jgi:hypothetical protein
MTDIVERLQQVQGDNEDAREAVDTIKRLRQIIAEGRYVLSTDPLALREYTGTSGSPLKRRPAAR